MIGAQKLSPFINSPFNVFIVSVKKYKGILIFLFFHSVEKACSVGSS